MEKKLLGKKVLYRKLQGTEFGKVVQDDEFDDSVLVRVDYKIVARVNRVDIIKVY